MKRDGSIGTKDIARAEEALRTGKCTSLTTGSGGAGWGDAEAGAWPPGFPHDERYAFTLDEIARWMRVFLTRYFSFAQFKRSAIPNGPKVSPAGSLSPRGDWRAPSDGNARVWLAELDAALPPS